MTKKTWQMALMNQGLCRTCKQPRRKHPRLCDACQEKAGKSMRDAYRIRHGIPTDAPLLVERRVVEWKGETLSLSAWAKRLGMRYGTLYQRLYRFKLPLDIALTAPVAKRNRNGRIG